MISDVTANPVPATSCWNNSWSWPVKSFDHDIVNVADRPQNAGGNHEREISLPVAH